MHQIFPGSPRSQALSEVRRQLVEAGISEVARTSATPPNSPVGTPPPELAVPMAPPIPRAPPPPPPSAVLTAAPASQTPAQILAKPEHASKSVADQMKLFVPANMRAAMDRLFANPAMRPILNQLSQNPPNNLRDVLAQLGTIDNFGQPANALQIATAFKNRGAPIAELTAAKMASYKAHAHDYMGEPASSSAQQMATRLTAQMDRDVDLITHFFGEAQRAGDLGAFYRSFTPAADASCHAVRMNALSRGLEDLTEAQARREVGPEVAVLTNPSKGHKDSEVLQAAFKLAGGLESESGTVTPGAVRAALSRIEVPADRIGLIIAELQRCALCDD